MVGKTLLVVNPCAGKGIAKKNLLDIITLLTDAGCEVTVLPTKKDNTAEQIKKFIIKHEGYAMAVACGGDGTLNLTVEGVLRSGKQLPIGYIPFGSTNDFAASLGIPSDFREAISHILSGKPCPHDIGLFGDRHFTYIACCGAFAETSYSTNQTLKNLLGHTAYMFNVIPSLASLRPLTMTVTADGETIDGRFIFCALSNTTVAAGTLKLDGHDVNFSDGLFELILIRYPQDLIEAGRVAKKLLSSNLNDPLIVLRHVSSCKITSKEAIGWSLDGENGGKSTSAVISVEKSAVEILK